MIGYREVYAVSVLSLTERSMPESIVESFPEIISRMESRGAVRDNPY